MNGKRLMIAAMVCVFWLTGCATAPETMTARRELIRNAEMTVAGYKRRDKSLAELFRSAEGYAVFPQVGKGGAGVGGAWGRGILFENGKPTAYCSITQGTFGLQLGGQVYSEIIFFKDKLALGTFKDGKLAISAQATAVAVTAGAGANAKYEDGVVVFTMGEKGLMYEASIGGQAFDVQLMER